MGRLIDHTGHRFGRLVVRGRASNAGRQIRWRCRCDCGEETIVLGGNLRNGHTVSCGCFQKEASSKASLVHDHSRPCSPTYISWKTMKQRCLDPSAANYHRYGGRGISICKRWLDSFENFLADMGEKPDWATGGIDRIDNDGNYEPSNCRWSTRSEQQHNRHDNQ